MTNSDYPGTPGVIVKVDQLLTLFKHCQLAFGFFCVPALGLLITGIWASTTCVGLRSIGVGGCAHYIACPTTSLTMYAWTVISFLNFVASVAMYTRMSRKHLTLSTPPAYSLTESPAPLIEPMISPPSYPVTLILTDRLVEKGKLPPLYQ
jgi:hypothetical protein